MAAADHPAGDKKTDANEHRADAQTGIDLPLFTQGRSMTLQEVPLTIARGELPEAVRRLLSEADARANRFLRARR